MSLSEAPASKHTQAPLKTTSIFSGAYVLHLVSLPSFYALSASSPDNAIHFYDKSRLDSVRTIAGHENAITSLRAAANFGGSVSPVLLTSSKDGVVKAWDGRAPTNGPISEHPAILLIRVATELKASLHGMCVNSDRLYGYQTESPIILRHLNGWQCDRCRDRTAGR